MAGKKEEREVSVGLSAQTRPGYLANLPVMTPPATF
jgi:hypothetical protein